jgi:hypothetical protein
MTVDELFSLVNTEIHKGAGKFHICPGQIVPTCAVSVAYIVHGSFSS